MSAGIRTRVAFHVTDGEIDPESVRVEGNTIVADVALPGIEKNGRAYHIREVDGLMADPTTGTVKRNGHEAKLPRLEMRALLALMEAHPRGVTIEMMAQAVGPRSTTNTLKSLVNRTRASLGHLAYIETVHGVGWTLVLPLMPREKK